MYEKIYVALDNSRYSEACCEAAVSLAREFGAQVVGVHVYAARLHERRFRQMESTLPEEYLGDGALRRQRSIHNKLITLGLRLISESYLDSLARRCRRAEVPFSRKTLDGKNWERLVEDVTASECDLAVIGARGHGTSRADIVGSVCLRVLRRIRTDALVIKEPDGFEGEPGRGIVVALDGSQEAFGALQAALAFGKAYGRPVEAVAAYDPYFHYGVFRNMVEALSPEAARLFRFREQERLHEEIIDTGLARLYQNQLEAAQRLAQTLGTTITTTLLAGRAADQLVDYVQRTPPWLLLVGRTGTHSEEGLDLGSVTEHLLRFAPCNLLVVGRRFSPPPEVWGPSTVRWTTEAEAVLERVPPEHRAGLRLLVQRVALEDGHTVVTASLVNSAAAELRPRAGALRHMEEAALSVALEGLQTESGPVYLCPVCSYATGGIMPSACPVCRQDGEAFVAVGPDVLEAIARPRGNDSGTSSI